MSKKLGIKKYKQKLRKETWHRLNKFFHFNPDTDSFVLPFTDIQYPLNVDGNNLNLSLVEVGCTPFKKIDKLEKTRKLFFDFWKEYYQKRAGLDWIPNIFGVLACYNPDCEIPIGKSPDPVVHYHTITEKMVASLNPVEKDRICSSDGELCRNYRSQKRLHKILEENNPEELHNFIMYKGNEKGRNETGNSRGLLAEILVLKDLQRYAQNNPDFYFDENSHLKFPNRTYCNGTEIDGLATFYKEDDFRGMIDFWDGLEHTSVIRAY